MKWDGSGLIRAGLDRRGLRSEGWNGPVSERDWETSREGWNKSARVGLELTVVGEPSGLRVQGP